MEKEAAIKGAKLIDEMSKIKKKIELIDRLIVGVNAGNYWVYLHYYHQFQVSEPDRIDIPDEMRSKMLQDIRICYAAKLTLMEEELKKL
jgi:hypothetical protein